MVIKDAESWVEKNAMDYILGPLSKLISFYSASALTGSAGEDAIRKAGLENAGNHILDELKGLGFDVRLEEIAGANPLIVGEYISDPKLPTILFYGHYDIQGIDDLNLWRNPPFTLAIENGKMVARGIADDKGQMAAHFLAWKYFFEKNKKLPCNIKILIEGDEESGITTESGLTPVDQYVKDHAESLSCDAVIISDTSTPIKGVPAITIRTKGILKAKAASNSVEGLIAFLDRSHSWEQNKVNYPGFYDNISMPEVDEKLEKRLISGFMKETKRNNLYPEEGFNIVRHANFRPTHDPLYLRYVSGNPAAEGICIKLTAYGPIGTVHSGLFGGPVLNPSLQLAHTLAGLKEKGIDFIIDYLDYGSPTGDTKIYPEGYAQITVKNADYNKVNDIIKELYSAAGFSQLKNKIRLEKVDDRGEYLSRMKPSSPEAILSNRLVAGQDPNAIFAKMEEFAKETSLDVELALESGSFAYVADTDNPIHEAVKSGMKKGYGKRKLLEAGLGGSIPVADAFSKYLGAPVIFAGFAEPGERIHDANEELSIFAFYAGTKSMIYAYENIGKLK